MFEGGWVQAREAKILFKASWSGKFETKARDSFIYSSDSSFQLILPTSLLHSSQEVRTRFFFEALPSIEKTETIFSKSCLVLKQHVQHDMCCASQEKKKEHETEVESK